MFNFLRRHKYLVILSFIFFVLAGSLIFNSGYQHCVDTHCELYFSEWQMHDSLWHISLAKLAFNSYPFHNPFYAGAELTGYNFTLDLILFLLMKLGIPAMTGYFIVLPALALFLYLLASWQYLREVSHSKTERYLLTFFLFFGTSLGYLATLYADRTLSGATLRGFPVVTSLHPASMLLNLPYAFSLPLLIYLLLWLRRPGNHSGFLTLTMLSFFAFGLKFYAGVAVALLIVVDSLYHLNWKRLLGLGLGSSLAYFLFYRGGELGFPFAFAPFALTHVLIDDIHLFYNQNLTLARYYLYENLQGMPIRLILLELLSIILFLLVNWGTRLLSFFYLGRLKDLDWSVKSLLIPVLILGLIPLFFVQKGGWYNTMQFMYYSTFLLSLFTAHTLASFYAKNPKRTLWLILLITLPLLPTTLEQLTYYVRPKNLISSEEVTALETLKRLPLGVVHVNRPWAKRALIPAFAEKEMFYLDSDQLMLMLPSHTTRLDLVRKYDGGSIHQVPADYYFIYKHEVASEDSLTALSNNPGIQKVYDSPKIAIFALPRQDDTIE